MRSRSPCSSARAPAPAIARTVRLVAAQFDGGKAHAPVYAACYSPRMRQFLRHRHRHPASARRIPARRCCARVARAGLTRDRDEARGQWFANIDGAWKSADALALLDANDPQPRVRGLQPVRASVAAGARNWPRATRASTSGLPGDLIHACAPRAASADAVVVEGVGGWANAAVVVADAGRYGARWSCRSCSSSDCAWAASTTRCSARAPSPPTAAG